MRTRPGQHRLPHVHLRCPAVDAPEPLHEVGVGLHEKGRPAQLDQVAGVAVLERIPGTQLGDRYKVFGSLTYLF